MEAKREVAWIYAIKLATFWRKETGEPAIEGNEGLKKSMVRAIYSLIYSFDLNHR